MDIQVAICYLPNAASGDKSIEEREAVPHSMSTIQLSQDYKILNTHGRSSKSTLNSI